MYRFALGKSGVALGHFDDRGPNVQERSNRTRNRTAVLRLGCLLLVGTSFGPLSHWTTNGSMRQFKSD